MRTLRLSLAGTVILALLGGLGLTAVAQDGAIDPMAPGYFTLVSDTGAALETTDPRFGGTFVANEPDEVRIAGGGNRTVYSGLVHIENEQGAWKGWTSGFAWEGEVRWHEQMWFAGEGAYEGLSAVAVGQCCPGGEMIMEGIIFEGDVPPLWESTE